jgi:hypothetical protein
MTPIVVDLQTLCMADLADAMDAAGVDDLTNATGGAQVRMTAAFAWVVHRREDPAFTFDDALRLPMGSISVVGADAEGEAPRGASNGAPLLASPVSGLSTPST